MNTLLTGFGPFLEVVSNPTERLVRHFDGRSVSGHNLTGLVLPVSYLRASRMLIEALEHGDELGRPFDLVWMLGVATSASAWRVERFGRNRNDAVADADGNLPSEVIAQHGPEVLESTIPVASVVLALESGNLPAVPSDSAGGYLCNHEYYTALLHIQQSGSGARAGFLHVPEDNLTRERSEVSVFTFDQHIEAIRVSLAVLASETSLV